MESFLNFLSVGSFMKFKTISAFCLPIALVMAAFPARAQQRLYAYSCSDGKSFQAEYAPESVNLTFSDNTVLTLPQVISGSGTRYSNGQITLYSKGENAFIEEGGQQTYSSCTTQLTASDASPTGSENTGETSTGASSSSTATQGRSTESTAGSTSSETMSSGTTSSNTSSSEQVIRRTTVETTTRQSTTQSTPTTPAPTAQSTEAASGSTPVPALW